MFSSIIALGSTRYVKIATILIAFVTILGYIFYLKFTISDLQVKIAKEKSNYDILLAEYTVNAKKYNEKIKEYERSFKEIDLSTDRDIQQIKNYKGKPNENDCDVATRIYNSIKF